MKFVRRSRGEVLKKYPLRLRVSAGKDTRSFIGISLKIIWQVVTVDLPVLHQQIAALR